MTAVCQGCDGRPEFASCAGCHGAGVVNSPPARPTAEAQYRAAYLRRQFRRLLVVAFLAGALVTLSTTSCAAQMVTLVRDTATDVMGSVSYRYLAGVEGVTICYDGRSYNYLNLTSGMSALEEADTRAHEAMHREQHERAGGCEAFGRTYRTPKGMLEAEAEAFHAGACVAIAGGADAESLERVYVQRIYTTYMGGGTPVFEVLEAYRRYPCKPESQDRLPYPFVGVPLTPPVTP